MLSYWNVPACGLVAFAILRVTRAAWTAGLGVALLVGVFAPAPAAGVLAATLVASRRARPPRRVRRAARDRRRRRPPDRFDTAAAP